MQLYLTIPYLEMTMPSTYLKTLPASKTLDTALLTPFNNFVDLVIIPVL